MADALLDAALDLALRGDRVDDPADIVHRHDALDLDDARFRIDMHFGEVGGKGIGLRRLVGPVRHDVGGGYAAGRPHGFRDRHEAAGLGDDEDLAFGKVEFVGLHLQLHRRPFENGEAHLAGGHLRGGADHVGRVAGKGADIPRHHIRIAMDDTDILEADTEFFRNDLRQGGMRPGAETGSARQQRHRAVLVDLHGGVALLLDARIGRGAVHFAADAPALADMRVLRVRRAVTVTQAIPVKHVHAVLEADFETVAEDRVAGRGDIAFAHDVLQLQIRRVHAQPFGRLIHLNIERIIALHDTVAAESPVDRRVGVDTTAFQPHVLAAIERGGGRRADDGHARTV